MSKTALQLAQLIQEKKDKKEETAFIDLRAKIIKATSEMAAELKLSVVIVLNETDLLALNEVTERLRDLGYRFRFIEKVDQNDEILEHKLLVSVAHLVA